MNAPRAVLAHCTVRESAIHRLCAVVSESFCWAAAAPIFGVTQPRPAPPEYPDHDLKAPLQALRVAPANTAELAAVLRICSEEKIAVLPVGAGLQQETGCATTGEAVALGMRRFNVKDHYDPGDLTIGIGAGTTLRELDAHVRPDRLWLPVLRDAARSHFGAVSIGGALATAMAGPLKHAFGGVRDFCIGVHFVTGDGVRGKGGGRVVKNVAGYDLMKLLIGSFGTLGVITSASFKLFPRPQQTVAFICRVASLRDAIEVRDLVLKSPVAPLCLEMISPAAAAALHSSPNDGLWRLIIGVSGTEREISRSRSEFGNAVTSEVAGDEAEQIWAKLEDFEHEICDTARASITEAIAASDRAKGTVLASVSCPIAEVLPVLTAAEKIAAAHELQLLCVGRATGSLLLALFNPRIEPGVPLKFAGADEPLLPAAQQIARQNEPSMRRIKPLIAAIHALRAAVPAQTAITLRRLPPESVLLADLQKTSWQLRSDELETMRTLKNALDPAWILNRGRYFV